MSEEQHSENHTNYVKIWAILVALLVVSVVGPMAEIPWLTLVTAFGIACVKAYLVLVKFMHIGAEQRFIAYMTTTFLVLMFIFFAGTAPDVMEHEGTNWEKPAWLAEAAHPPSAGGDHH